jgi:GntR family transcriptional regulator
LPDSNVKFELDLKSRVPIFVQIVEQVKEMIAAGKLKPGDQLPTVRQVALDLMINPNTVSRAFLELEHAGITTTQRGIGTFVSADIGASFTAKETARRTQKLVRGFLRGMMELGHPPEDILAEVRKALDTSKEE